MSTKKLYQIYDLTAGQTIGPIIIEHRDAAAIRAFEGVLANKDTTPGQYPEEFELWAIGEQDETLATLTAFQQPVILYTGRQWKEKQNSLQLVPNGELHQS